MWNGPDTALLTSPWLPLAHDVLNRKTLPREGSHWLPGSLQGFRLNRTESVDLAEPWELWLWDPGGLEHLDLHVGKGAVLPWATLDWDSLSGVASFALLDLPFRGCSDKACGKLSPDGEEGQLNSSCHGPAQRV